MNTTPKTKTTYTVTLLDGTEQIFTSTLALEWAVVVEDSQDRPHNASRHGIYFKSGSRAAAVKKVAEARGIAGEYAFARVELVPVTRVS